LTTVTDINQVLKEFNSATPSLQFTMEEETDNGIHFLDLTIKKNNEHFEFEIYRKPTCTDIIIPQDSCHPTEHKTSAIRYLNNRNNTYQTNQDSKKKEHDIINQILRNNHYDHSHTPTQTKKPPLHPHPHQ
jgi:aspartyl-tRNA synthetase